MPISGGTAGAHDDAMHQGSAKRDVVNGVAGLDAVGSVLVVGASVLLVRDAGENITIKERTSAEISIYMHRDGVNDYVLRVNSGGSYSVVQLANMKDAINGIAALDAGGALLAPGSEVKLTRDGSENIEVVERTSGDIVYRWTRMGANDYECRINCGGVACIIQNDSMKDIAGGIAGLDANVQLDVLQMRPCVEEYSNHLGAVDNFTQTGTAGNGTATTVVANHHMNLSTGLAINGHSLFESKSDFTLSSKPLVLNFKIQNIINGAGGTRVTYFGLMADFTFLGVANGVYFAHSTGDVWSCYTESASAVTYADIASISNGDLCTIVATSSKLEFFVNGALVFTATTNIPTVAMEFGAVVHEYGAGAGTARETAIDLMSIKRYV